MNKPYSESGSLMRQRKLWALAGLMFGGLAFAATEYVPDDTIVGNGQVLDVINNDPIETQGDVTVIDGGDAVFWSSDKVTLKPGFWAVPNGDGRFRAAIDSDFDGYTDIEELADSDNDGMLDGYEYEIIEYSQFDAYNDLSDITLSGDFDQDGVSNAAEISAGTSLVGQDAPSLNLVVF